jgi:hypothetical protein
MPDRLSDIINVKDWGAVGNWSGDDSGAIQAAIDACIARGGGQVFFPPGGYMVRHPLVVGHDTIDCGVELIGSGKRATIIWTDGFSDPLGYGYAFSKGNNAFDCLVRIKGIGGGLNAKMTRDGASIEECNGGVGPHNIIFNVADAKGASVRACGGQGPGNTVAGGTAIAVGNGMVSACRFVGGFDTAIAISGNGSVVIGMSVETCRCAIRVGWGPNLSGPGMREVPSKGCMVSAIQTERVESQIELYNADSFVMTACALTGHAGLRPTLGITDMVWNAGPPAYVECTTLVNHGLEAMTPPLRLQLDFGFMGAPLPGVLQFTQMPADNSYIDFRTTRVTLHDGTGGTVNRGSTIAQAVDNLTAYLSGSADAVISKCTYVAGGAPHDRITITMKDSRDTPSADSGSAFPIVASQDPSAGCYMNPVVSGGLANTAWFVSNPNGHPLGTGLSFVDVTVTAANKFKYFGVNSNPGTYRKFTDPANPYYNCCSAWTVPLQWAMRFRKVSNSVIFGMQPGPVTAQATFDMDWSDPPGVGLPVHTNNVIRDCYASWGYRLPSDLNNLTGWKVMDCSGNGNYFADSYVKDSPIGLAFANLPGGSAGTLQYGPFEGQEFTIVDGGLYPGGGAATWGDRVQGGGTGRYVVRYNGSYWTRIA